MFTGIIEATGKIIKIEKENNNIHLTIESKISTELEVNQSVAHNGVCLSVVSKKGKRHVVTAVEETIKKTNLGKLREGDKLNLERALKIGDRLDGHYVQGHVDSTVKCIRAHFKPGSNEYTYEFDPKFSHLLIEKGSVCINGVSLTCFNITKNTFTVAVIPLTYNSTNFMNKKIKDIANIEFDIIGKYLSKFNKKSKI